MYIKFLNELYYIFTWNQLKHFTYNQIKIISLIWILIYKLKVYKISQVKLKIQGNINNSLSSIRVQLFLTVCHVQYPIEYVEFLE